MGIILSFPFLLCPALGIELRASCTSGKHLLELITSSWHWVCEVLYRSPKTRSRLALAFFCCLFFSAGIFSDKMLLLNLGPVRTKCKPASSQQGKAHDFSSGEEWSMLGTIFGTVCRTSISFFSNSVTS